MDADTTTRPEAVSRHRACWYGRRAATLPSDLGFHTIEDGQLLFCAHPMLFPVVGYQFDVRNCETCDFYRARASSPSASSSA